MDKASLMASKGPSPWGEREEGWKASLVLPHPVSSAYAFLSFITRSLSSTKKAAPSPRIQPLLSLSNGRQGLDDNMKRALKPLIVNFAKLSVPPTMARSASPFLINRAPYMSALAEEEQAVLIVLTIPLIPNLFWR